ncbi:Thioredoxin [Chryseobacterium sp. RU37D]|uniref:thioredoxin family protein n=1 Tax=Chryseobacterium sp. RU37D TaxID=1907397 RepID=UPI0009574E56|nr:thioredoxin family protein [Chryseobacterium sp. RU37D]SIQ23740.1 Thioredoxin [Chryseobacterium sp. RU37D]
MLQSYWKKGISFESHLSRVQDLAGMYDEKELGTKHMLFVERTERVIKNYHPDPEQRKKFNTKNFNGNILIIAEGWCGDCSQSVPVIKQFFGDKNPIRILYRDENPDLMQLFLTNGNEAVPIVLFLDSNCNLITHWGPRTKHGVELLEKFKSDPENYPREYFLKDLHEYYDHNNGFDIVEEILEIL